ncbi:endonuclease [Palleronia caenipelagi]|uniref:Endonuclease n=1 Tax=Palleronia caenipelagi TaxID=2489174 RepID=A0A547PR37_9RHOB|nr:endonuclease [Palleronia caenipelagi]TRD16608.1 endonuclease [Palleronia caenipelagi]
MPEYFVAFWNVENLFAPETYPDRPDWLQRRIGRELKGWDEALFQRKLDQLAVVISAMNDGRGPDILGVCEVENRFVLDRLVDTISQALPHRNYGVQHAESELDKRGIDTAFIFDDTQFSVPDGLVFSHFVLRRTGTRDIVQVTFRSQAGNDLIIMCNHWPSRSGGAEKSAGFRATAGETVGYWHERIRDAVGPRPALLVMGDLNDNPWDGSVTFNANATRERGDVERSESAKLWNLSWSYLRSAAIDHQGNKRGLDGSLYHGGDGDLFDQILAARALIDGKGPFHLCDDTAGLVLLPQMVSHRVSEGPLRFGLPKGDPARHVNRNGFSDHFPVSVIIREDASDGAAVRR